MGKPIKPSKNLVYCYACKRRKMLFEEKSEADNFIKYNHGGPTAPKNVNLALILILFREIITIFAHKKSTQGC